MMADVKAASSSAAAGQPTPKPPTSSQHSTTNQSSTDGRSEFKGGGRQKWGENRDENCTFHPQADEFADPSSNNKKEKRPEVQHYKPPRASKKPEDSPGQEYEENNQDEMHHARGDVSSAKRTHRGRGRRGGHTYHNQQYFNAYNSHENIEDTSRKIKNMSIDDEYHKYNENIDHSYYKGGSSNRRKKKPEQLHYIPKKLTAGHEGSSGSLERNSSKDNLLTGTQKEEETTDGSKQTKKVKEQNPTKEKKDNDDATTEETGSKNERFEASKRNKNKSNRKEHRKEFKDYKESHEVHDRRTERRETGNKGNFHAYKDAKENGYPDIRKGPDNTEKDPNKKMSSGATCNDAGNETNIPPRLRGSDKHDRPNTTDNERGGKVGMRSTKSGPSKGARWADKHSRGNSPQAEPSSTKDDMRTGGNRPQGSMKDDTKRKDEHPQKYQGNKPNFDSKGQTHKNNQMATGGGQRFSKNEYDKDGRHHNQGIKSSLSFSSDLSRSSDSFQQQHPESHGTQGNTNRNKRNSLSYRGNQNFTQQNLSQQSPNNTKNSGTGPNRRNTSPKRHSQATNYTPQDVNDNSNQRTDNTYQRLRNNDTQHGVYRRGGQLNRNSKDMSDWRYYREGSHQSMSSDYENQFQHDGRGVYHRGGVEDRSWDMTNYNSENGQINPSHREHDPRERADGVNQGRQNLGRSNSGVFGGATGSLKHSGSSQRTSIPPRFQKYKDLSHQGPQGKGDIQHRQNQGDETSVQQTESHYRGTKSSESDWGSWKEQVPSQTQMGVNEGIDSNENKKIAHSPIKNNDYVDDFDTEASENTPSSTLTKQEPSTSVAKMENSSNIKERIDSFTSDDFSSYSKVTDWSLEVEEEEEQQREQLQHQQKQVHEMSKSDENSRGSQHSTAQKDLADAQVPHAAGIIRLPSQHTSSASASSNWRRDQIQHQGQQNQDIANNQPIHSAENQLHMMHDSSNPAWRGISNPEILHLQLQQQMAVARAAANAANRGNRPPYDSSQAPRYLFDHKNPNKPIHVGPNSNNPIINNPRLLSSGADVGIIPGARFALDPRFSHPPRPGVRHHTPSHDSSSHQTVTPQHPYSQAYHPMTGQPLSVQPQGNFHPSYRPPFPNTYSGTGQRNIAPASAMSGPPPSTPQLPSLGSKQGAPDNGRQEWQQHSAPNVHPQMMQLETKPDFETIKQNELALFETSKLIVTNDFLSQGGPKLRRLWDNEVAQARHNILFAFQRLLQNDLVFCAEKDVEFLIWRICFYNLVETLKSMLKHSEQSLSALSGGANVPPVGPLLTPEIRDMIEQIIRSLLDEGLEFYSYMLDTLDKTYQIGLDRYYDVLEPRSPDANMRCVLVSAQKCLLCLGDLARYKEQTQETSNYGKARQYYQKASHIDTRNGRPYNQLAILAYTTKRKFEAVYYNMRCLSCKSSVRSSQESLTVIFEDIAKKWELIENKRLEDKEARQRKIEQEKENSHLIKGTRLR